MAPAGDSSDTAAGKAPFSSCPMNSGTWSLTSVRDRRTYVSDRSAFWSRYCNTGVGAGGQGEDVVSQGQCEIEEFYALSMLKPSDKQPMWLIYFFPE